MNHCCVQVELNLNVSAEEWRAACRSAVPVLAVPGLRWKVRGLDEEAMSAGGFYLFRDRASAEAHADGPVIARLRSLPAVRDVRVRLFPVFDEASQETRAFDSAEKEVRLDLVG